MAWCRVRDLMVSFQPDGMLLVQSVSHGVAARIPPPAFDLLVFCDQPRTVEDVFAELGPPGKAVFEALCRVGILVDPEAAWDTPTFFQSFASITLHRKMLADRARMDAYAEAIRRVVQPGSVVMDAGTGSGVLACMAAQAGARKVYAVDNSELMDVAREVVQRSGVADVVELVRGDFRTVKLPEPVDVIVTETFGPMALAEGAAADLREAKRRLLKPDGVMLPHGVSLWMAPVGDVGLLADTLAPFGVEHGVDLRPMGELALRRGRTLAIDPASLLHPGLCIAALPWPSEDGLKAAVRFDALAAGAPATLVGFAAWFVVHLTDGIDLPTGPTDPLTHWEQVYLPAPPAELPPEEPLELMVKIGPAPEERRGLLVQGSWRCGGVEGATWHRIL